MIKKLINNTYIEVISRKELIYIEGCHIVNLDILKNIKEMFIYIYIYIYKYFYFKMLIII